MKPIDQCLDLLSLLSRQVCQIVLLRRLWDFLLYFFTYTLLIMSVLVRFEPQRGCGTRHSGRAVNFKQVYGLYTAEFLYFGDFRLRLGNWSTRGDSDRHHG